MKTRIFATLLAGAALAGPALAAPFAYIADHTERNLQVVDLATSARVATVHLQSGAYGYLGSVVAHPASGRVYVRSNNQMLALAAGSNAVVGSIPLLASPYGQPMVVSPDGATGYALAQERLQWLDLRTLTPGRAVSLRAPASSLALSGDGTSLYVLIADATPELAVIDTAGGQIRQRIALAAGGARPQGIALSPAGDKAYVQLQAAGAAQWRYLEVDLAKGSALTVTPEPAPGVAQDLTLVAGDFRGLALRGDGRTAYAVATSQPPGAGAGRWLVELDLATRRVTRTLRTDVAATAPGGAGEAWAYRLGDITLSRVNGRPVAVLFVHSNRSQAGGSTEYAHGYVTVDLESWAVLQDRTYAWQTQGGPWPRQVPTTSGDVLMPARSNGVAVANNGH